MKGAGNERPDNFHGAVRHRDEDARVGIAEVLGAIRNGGVRVKPLIEKIRQTIRRELDKHGDHKKAKQAAGELKKQLSGVIWSGTFSQRANDKLMKHSGLLCADLDSLGAQLVEVREKLKQSPHLFALFLSPTGDGLKAVFRVPVDAAKHAGKCSRGREACSRADRYSDDQACKDPARLCFMSYDPEIYVNDNAIEIEALPEPEKPKATVTPNGEINLSERQRIAVELLGPIEWLSDARDCDMSRYRKAHTAEWQTRLLRVFGRHAEVCHSRSFGSLRAQQLSQCYRSVQPHAAIANRQSGIRQARHAPS
jgi:hypothetical protein